MDIRTILKSGEVERYHSNPNLASQKLSDHEWRVALLLQRFYPDCSKNAILNALTHDAAEMFTGDIPSPAKRREPALKEMLDALEDKYMAEMGISFPVSEKEEYWLKNCDILEGLLYTARRIINHGELLGFECFEKWCDYYRTRETPIEMDDFVAPYIYAVDRIVKGSLS